MKLQWYSTLYIYPMRNVLLLFLFIPTLLTSQVSQDSAAFFIREVYRKSYTELKAYDWLTTLCKQVGHRLAGSEGDTKAVIWAQETLDTFGLDRVWLQPVKVPRWVRGEPEQVVMYSNDFGAVTLNALALGNSPGTGRDGLRATVIEVKSLDALRAIPDEEVKGKIVFFNRPMDMGHLSTFGAYGGAVDQRGRGPRVAAEKGAIAAVVRSMASRLDDHPHTGTTFFDDSIATVPSVAISTNDAELLGKAVAAGPVEVFIRTTCQMYPDVQSFNVIGEIRGHEFPDEIILVGGHLDSWDVGEGAHDDGAGCTHAMEAIYRLVKMGYKPKRTIRCVLFANEENGLRGGREYADQAFAKNEYHMAAIESDGGGGTAQAFGVSAGEGKLLDVSLAHLSDAAALLEPYDIELKPGGGGADIGPLKPKVGLLIGLRPDNARYFDYHHTHIDVLENVHPRELATGSAALTALVYLLDQYGIGQ